MDITSESMITILHLALVYKTISPPIFTRMLQITIEGHNRNNWEYVPPL